ncbi:protein kinase domain-containing protein [Streptomyces purpureus]|uniref:protein kinase domain-containing protein n=1 Tax=Streptomyces purpureus TaxID=1951 RepID=UPI000375E0F3|nr:protein kinase [Streptomyces purpureus]
MVELRGSGAEPLEAEDPPRIGAIPLVGRLGAGGMGRVYLGVHQGRYVAVKQLLASVVGEDKDFLRRFGHELDNLARLPAETTAPLLAGDRTARPPWFATAYVPGITLREAVDLHGAPLPVPALWLLLREAAAGLASVHALGMVHRDIKPSNVMLTLDGLTLIDFGVARAAEQSQLTRTGMVVGTPAYMAPEQASGTKGVSGAADVFALGSVLAYAACGRPPFGDESGHGVLYRIVHEEPDLEPLRALAPDLAEVVAGCLAKDPEARPSAAELLERASRQGPFAASLWPAAISERLSERAAFAADVQEVDVPTLPLAGETPEPERKSEPEPERTSEPEPKSEARPEGPERPERTERPGRPERRRRTRVVLAVVPVVVVAGGTTLVVQNLPHTSTPGNQAGSTPSSAVSAPADPTPPTKGGTPPRTAPPSPPKDQDKGQDAGKGQSAGAGGGTQVTAGSGAATGTQDGSGGSAGSGPSGGSGASTGSGTPGTSTGTGASGTPGGATPTATKPPTSGTYRYRNGDNNRCIIQVYGSSDHGACSDSTARWTMRSGPDGTFKLENRQTGGCLYSNGLGQAVFVGDCSGDASRLWSTGPGGSLRAEYGGGCLDLGMSSGLVTASCAGEASQRCTRQS